MLHNNEKPPRAHPRRCGADGETSRRFEGGEGSSPQVRGRSTSTSFDMRISGSSPQVRGRLVKLGGPVPHCRLIPAGAGQMISPRGRGLSLSAHPRRCGADVACYFCVSCPTGSSPQVRGRYPPCALEHVFGGLIPAGAGQIPDAAPARVTVPAHPRRCGADGRLYSKYMLMRGSSPQVRGRSTPMPRRAKVGRLIPAGAGQIRATVFG